jgi:hypothetical protein
MLCTKDTKTKPNNNRALVVLHAVWDDISKPPSPSNFDYMASCTTMTFRGRMSPAVFIGNESHLRWEIPVHIV